MRGLFGWKKSSTWTKWNVISTEPQRVERPRTVKCV